MTRRFPSRKFNNVWLDEPANKVVKLSSDIEKLEHEFLYYRSLPASVRPFFPQELSFTDHGTYAILETQYISTRTLSDYLVNDSWYPLTWWNIKFAQLALVREKFDLISKPNPNQIQHAFYMDKAIQRMSGVHVDATVPTTSSMITINGVLQKNWNQLVQLVEDYIISVSIPELHFIHGDWCFSNILADSEPTMYPLKFIDPRGEFGPEINFGDRAYDLAKLYHSIHGRYDEIVTKQYTYNHTYSNTDNVEIEYRFRRDDDPHTGTHISELVSLFHEYFPIDKKYLTVLEGLLFISMVSLHETDIQPILYARGVELLNQGLDM